MRNTSVMCMVASTALVVGWISFAASRGISGLNLLVVIVCSIVGGVFAGFAITQSLTDKKPRWRLIFPAVFCGIVAPFLTLTFLPDNTSGEKRETGRSFSSVAREPSQVGENIHVNRDALRQNTKSVAETARETGETVGFDRGRIVGRDEYFEKPTTYDRRDEKVGAVQIGTRAWRVNFQRPWNTEIITDIPFNDEGDAYYVRVDRDAPLIQMGWVGTDTGRRRFTTTRAPAEALTRSAPFRYRVSAGKPSDATLAFNVSAVPDGQYEITITKCPVKLESWEYAPGIPLDKNW